MAASMLQKLQIKTTDDLIGQLDVLKTETDQLKSELFGSFKQQLIDFAPLLQSSRELQEQSDQLHSRYEQLTLGLATCSQRIGETVDSAVRQRDQLGVFEKQLGIVEQLLGIRRCLEALSGSVNVDDLSVDDVVEAVEQLALLRRLVAALDDHLAAECGGVEQVLIVGALRREMSVVAEQVADAVDHVWRLLFRVDVVERADSRAPAVTVCLQTAKATDAVAKLLRAMHSSATLERKLLLACRQIGQFLAFLVTQRWPLQPTADSVDSDSTSPMCTALTRDTNAANEFQLVLRLVGNVKTDSTTSDAAVQLDELAVGLQTVFDVLERSMFRLPVEEVTMMERLSEAVSEQVVNDLIRWRLRPALAACVAAAGATDLYGATVDATRRLVNGLHAARVPFLTAAASRRLDDFLASLDQLLLADQYQLLLEQARQLMKRDLFETVNMERRAVASDMDTSTPDALKLALSKSSIGDDLFAFARCTISASAGELVELLEKVLLEEVRKSDAGAAGESRRWGLLKAARDIMELYCVLGPVVHKKPLALPAGAALFHNNCYFLAHSAMLFGFRFYKNATAAAGNEPNATSISPEMCTLVDYTCRLREIADSLLLEQVAGQEQQLWGILEDADSFELIADESTRARCEKALRAIVGQLTSLQKVWGSGCLPRGVYLRLIGRLVEAALERLVEKCVALDDIRTSDCDVLTLLFNNLLQQVRLLFAEGADAAAPRSLVDDKAVLLQAVPAYGRFEELLFVLQANLLGILDRWADGQGLLAAHFKPDELRRLVRALFENSDLRADALNKIK